MRAPAAMAANASLAVAKPGIGVMCARNAASITSRFVLGEMQNRQPSFASFSTDSTSSTVPAPIVMRSPKWASRRPIVSNGSGEFSGTSAMRMPASQSASTTGIASAADSPRRIATIGIAAMRARNSFSATALAVVNGGIECEKAATGDETRIDRPAGETEFGQCRVIKAADGAAADQGRRATSELRKQRERIGNLGADQEAAQMRGGIGAIEITAYHPRACSEQQCGQAEAAFESCPHGTREHHTFARLAFDDRLEQPGSCQPVVNLARHAGEEIDDAAVRDAHPLRMRARQRDESLQGRLGGRMTGEQAEQLGLFAAHDVGCAIARAPTGDAWHDGDIDVADAARPQRRTQDIRRDGAVGITGIDPANVGTDHAARVAPLDIGPACGNLGDQRHHACAIERRDVFSGGRYSELYYIDTCSAVDPVRAKIGAAPIDADDVAAHVPHLAIIVWSRSRRRRRGTRRR